MPERVQPEAAHPRRGLRLVQDIVKAVGIKRTAERILEHEAPAVLLAPKFSK